MFAPGIVKKAIGLGILALLLMGIFGFYFTMPMDSGGHMTGCPFMGATAVCNMTPLEHMAAWQSMFTSTPAQAANVLTLLLLAATLVASFFSRLFPRIDADLLGNKQRLYQKRSFAFAYATPLQEAFSQGILNSKAY